MEDREKILKIMNIILVIFCSAAIITTSGLVGWMIGDYNARVKKCGEPIIRTQWRDTCLIINNHQ